MNYMLVKADSLHILCPPAFPGDSARFRPLVDMMNGCIEPWTFPTREAADKARLAIDHKATIAEAVHDEIVLESEVA